MKKIKKWLLDSYLPWILTTIFIPSKAGVDSFLEGKGYFLTLYEVFESSWVGVLSVLIILVIITLVWRRIINLKAANGFVPLAISVGQVGEFKDVGMFPYSSVKWQVRYAIPWNNFSGESPRVDDFELDSNPLCPTCELPLDEKKTFFGKTLLSCFNCKFQLKHSVVKHILHNRAEKLLKVALAKRKSGIIY